MFLNNLIKNALFIFILLNIILINNLNYSGDIEKNLIISNKHSNYIFINNITNIPTLYLNVENIKYSFSKQFGLIEVIYFIELSDENYNIIRPSKLLSFYGLNFFCNLYKYGINNNIISIANIYENRFFFCTEYINIDDEIDFGIKIFKINSEKNEIEYFQHFCFTDKFFNINENPLLENNNRFNINYLYKNFNELLNKIKKYKNNISYIHEAYNLKSSYIQPPLFSLKSDIAQVEGKWYFNNIYETYFCFCLGDSCANFAIINMNNFQNCKYFFYLTIIDNNKDLYPKTHYLLSDFFDENIESSDAFPIFKEMKYKNYKVHYLTMSDKIYKQLCLNNQKCLLNSEIIYGVKKINGDILEKFIVLFLRLKAVIAAEKYYSIDNIFYNIDYITYIFLGHGVTYIKSYLYKDYLSPKTYNKILLPPYEKFIQLALDAGWKKENIIKIGYPRWDDYEIFLGEIKREERAIFLMFTWRKLKKGKNISDTYFKNLYRLLNNRKLNIQLNINNIKFFYCFHHSLKYTKIAKINEANIRIIEQNNISTLLKNSSLIITDFSSIIFDAIVQKKPLILFIPDGLEPNLEDIYSSEYCETINKIKNGTINLYEVFVDLNKVIKKIIYYIKNNFNLEDEKLKFYKEFRLKNKGNTKKFIKYIKHLE